VLTFGRAVSGDDYEAIAALAPGVSRAKAYWSFDPDRQRAAVTVYVGDTPAAVEAAKTALAAAADPNRMPRVEPARAVRVFLHGTVVIDPAYQFDAVLAGVRAALTDPDNGLFGLSRSKIGRKVYDSQIAAACLAVPGVRGVKRLRLIRPAILRVAILRVGEPDRRPADPDEGTYLRLDPTDLHLTAEAADAP
jgi:hypothetical protein